MISSGNYQKGLFEFDSLVSIRRRDHICQLHRSRDPGPVRKQYASGRRLLRLMGDGLLGLRPNALIVLPSARLTTKRWVRSPSPSARRSPVSGRYVAVCRVFGHDDPGEIL